jgi:hypothetical protein
MINVNTFSVAEPKQKKPLIKRSRRLEDNIEIDLRKHGGCEMDSSGSKRAGG